ncbi:transposase, Ptta/En/Spm, transposase, Tnp1/En/Spm-like protein [Tanacetum coccineum]|uniref:Transposase, Ptta/En/Spm, transposase, Tnp1/En/Spm-like protein n=1 Tax=Tanacetum coccineum TaxID=301880 RepID=A0ABQ5A1K3_9ASTR
MIMLKKLGSKGMVQGLPSIENVSDVCKDGLVGKHHRESFLSKSTCGPTFVDQSVPPQKVTKGIFCVLLMILAEKAGFALKCLRTDKGEWGIRRQVTTAYTPQQNRTLLNMARAVLSDQGVCFCYPIRRIIKELRVSVPALTKDHYRSKINTPYPERPNMPYSKYGINIIFWKISNVAPTPRNPQYAMNAAYPLPLVPQLINTTYPPPLDTAYRSSKTETEILEEEAEAMAETMEQYMSKTRTDYGLGVARPKINNKDQFELKGQFLKELRENTFSGSDNEDANEHIEKVLEIVDLFHVPNITVDQLML